MEEVLNFSLIKMRDHIQKRDFTAQKLCRFYLDRIEKYNPLFHAVVYVHLEALKKAEQIDKNLSDYKQKPLAGVPVLLKDVFCVSGMPTTAGSKILKNFISPYSAEIVERLEEAGAVILGKTNQDEFAMGNSTEHSIFGKTLNPWHKDYVPGGSSGGSAAAAALGFSPAGVGSDTGGSIRQPAGFCNVVGVKPTYGRVSRYGMIAYGSSLEQAGPLTKYVEDSALLLEILSGHDLKDSTSIQKETPSWSRCLNPDIKKLKIAFYMGDKPLDPEVKQVMGAVKDLFKVQAGLVQEEALPSWKAAVPAYYLISTSEASSNLARYDGMRYGVRSSFKPGQKIQDVYSETRGQGFGSEVKRRILMGTFCLSHGYYDQYYKKASQVRRVIRDELAALFSKYDVLVSPVSAAPPWKAGDTKPGSLESYMSDQFTVPANLAGLPALSVPAGFSSQGLPIGVQLMGRAFDEQSLLNAAFMIQRELKTGERKLDV